MLPLPSSHSESWTLSGAGKEHRGCPRNRVAAVTGDDGWIERFRLLVWPDRQANWEEIDRPPDSRAPDPRAEQPEEYPSKKVAALLEIFRGYLLTDNLRCLQPFTE